VYHDRIIRGVRPLVRRFGRARNGCLVVTADDVTVDGNGYAITSSEDAARGPAILATDAENVSVKNASLSGWQVGVAFDGVERGSVTNVRVTTAAIVGITIEGSSQDIAVADNGVRDGTDGVRLAAASDVAVRDNAFSGLTGTAVDLRANASDATVQNNTVSDTSGIGVRVTGPRTSPSSETTSRTPRTPGSASTRRRSSRSRRIDWRRSLESGSASAVPGHADEEQRRDGRSVGRYPIRRKR